MLGHNTHVKFHFNLPGSDIIYEIQTGMFIVYLIHVSSVLLKINFQYTLSVFNYWIIITHYSGI